MLQVGGRGIASPIWVSGIAISVSFPFGVGISLDGSGITYTSSVANNWENLHYYSNVKFSTAVAMRGPYQKDSDSLTFGYATYYDNT
jgi:hypothetical protein